MSQQIINVGVTSNDGTGDTLRVSQQKANSNFDELYARPDFTDAPSDGTLYGRKDGAWDSITGGGSTPNLQAVTDVGKVTTNEIKAKWFEFYDAANDAYGKVFFEDGIYTFYDSVGIIMFSFDNAGNDIRYNADGFNLYKNNGLLTSDRIRQEPDKDGTYAMLDDITADNADALKRDGSNANSDVDLGVYAVKATSVIVDTNGSTKFVEIKSDNISGGGYTQQLQEKNATFAYMDDIPDVSGLVPNTRTVNGKALSLNVTLNTDDIAESGTPTNKWFTNARAIASTLTSFVSGAGTVSATDTILQAIQKIVGNLGLKADLASPTFTGSPTAPTQSANDNSTKLATTAYVDTGLGLKATKSDIMILSSAYVLSNSTSLQKAFNVGSGGGGAFNASANKTYRFRCELDMTGLSGSTSAISFGFLGTATISSLSYKSNAIKAVLSNTSGGTITSIQVATISAITATSTATAAKAMITGIIRVSGAGTIIPAVATGVGNATSQVEANSFFEITELGSDTLTATSNIS